MNCQEALEVLIAGDERHFRWEPACSHVANCLTCQKQFREGTVFDQRMAEICRDVTVPAGLEQDLLAEVSGATLTKSSSSRLPLTTFRTADGLAQQAEVRPQLVSSRWFPRRRMIVAVAVVLCFGLSIASYFVWEASQRIPLEQVVQAAAQDFPDSEGLPQFNGFSQRVSLQLPQALRIDLDETAAKRISVGRQVAAVFVFSVRTEQGEVASGRLLVLPRRGVSNPPAWEGFSAEAVDYVNHACAWREGELVYVCSLNGSIEDLYRLFPPQQAG